MNRPGIFVVVSVPHVSSSSRGGTPEQSGYVIELFGKIPILEAAAANKERRNET